jgi:CheY-like chemotaxis protein
MVARCANWRKIAEVGGTASALPIRHHMPHRRSPGPTTKLPFRILVLDDDEHTLTGIVELLRDASYLVTASATYDAANRLLRLGTYDLLIADVRLRGYNGLNLIRQSHADQPDMALMIITGYDEPMMEIEAGRYGAEFVRKPIRPAEFLVSVSRLLAGVRRRRRWPRKRVIGGFRVTADGKPAAVVDVCYGGLRIELPAGQPLPATFDVEVAGIGLHLEVEPVWSHPADATGALVYGAALSSDATPAARTWRAIVDRLTA